VQNKEFEKKSRIAKLLPRAFKRKRRPKDPQNDAGTAPDPDDTLTLEGLEQAESDEVTLENLDLERTMSEQLKELGDVLDGDELADEEDIFGAFWRGVVTGIGPTPPSSPSKRTQDIENTNGTTLASSAQAVPNRVIGASDKDTLGLKEARVN